jgi:hypothetical protein
MNPISILKANCLRANDTNSYPRLRAVGFWSAGGTRSLGSARSAGGFWSARGARRFGGTRGTGSARGASPSHHLGLVLLLILAEIGLAKRALLHDDAADNGKFLTTLRTFWIGHISARWPIAHIYSPY